jgi:hypothetical protein
VPDKGFWIFLSLPTVWFVLSFGLLAVTIMLSVWERLGSVATNELHPLACPVGKLIVFKWVLLGMLFAGLFHFVFVFLRYRCMFT